MIIDPALLLLFVSAATTTILSPGPAVLMTISNSLQWGYRTAFSGIVGLSIGSLLIALITGCGLGALITTSPYLYALIKVLGIPYLFYLGWKTWRTQPVLSIMKTPVTQSSNRLTIEGILLACCNPGLIVFYLSLMPQCINAHLPYWPQFLTFAGTYAVLILLFHGVYAICSSMAAKKLLTANAARYFNRAAACCYGLLAMLVAWMTITPFLDSNTLW